MLKKVSLAVGLCACLFGEDVSFGGLEIIKDIEKSNLGVVENYGIDLNENKTTDTITASQMDNFNASNVADSMKYTSGVFFSPLGSRGNRGEPGFFIRGFNEQKIGIFIDGIPVHSIYDRQTDWAQFGIYDAEIIQISKGYVSSLYGANTMGGAINIVTKKPKKELEVDFKAQLSPANMQHAEFFSVGSNLGKFYMSASLSNIQRSYYIMSKSFSPTQYQPDLERVNSYYSNTKIALKFGIVPNESDEYVFNASYSKGDKGGIPSTASQGNFWDWPHYDKWNVNYIGRSKLSDSFTLHTKAWVDAFYNDLEMRGRWTGTSIVSGGPSGWSIYDDYTLGAYAGLDWLIGNSDLLKFVYSLKNDNHNNTNTNPSDNKKISDLTHYLTAEYTHAFNDKWRLGLTGSFVYNHILNLNFAGQKDSIKSNVWGLSGQAIAYYDPYDYLGFYATIGKKDNIPTIKEKYTEAWGTFIPNPNLQTESSLNVEIGGNYKPIENLNLSLALYYNRYLNKLSSRDAGTACANGSECLQFYNIRGFNAHAFGTEIGLQYTFSDKFMAHTSYSYIYNHQRDEDTGEMTNISGLPNHLWNLQMIIKPIKEIDIIAGTRLTSKIYQGMNAGYSSMVFLAVLKLVTRPIENLELGVGVDNLLDRNYYFFPGYNQEGRRIYAELRLKY